MKNDLLKKLPAINIGLVGAGTVGGGVLKLWREQSGSCQRDLRVPIKITHVVNRHLEVLRELPIPPDCIATQDVHAVIDNPDIQILVELVGGVTFARDLILAALKKGKQVITANKQLIAEHGSEIFHAAEAAGVSIYFEAAVGGGIPIIKTIREAMVANNFLSVLSIINGTCNYILTQMSQRNLPFETALQDAQQAGFAEKDPTLDIGGHDSGHKIAIMASLAHGCHVPYDRIYVQGIRKITAEDLRYARHLGYTIKLLGIINLCPDGQLDVRVHPAMLPHAHILSSVNGVYNAVWIKGSAAGSILLYGHGAGAMPTASAVLSDIIDCARDLINGVRRRIPMNYYTERNLARILPMEEISTRYYFRFSVVDRPGVLAGITTVLGREQIAIASMIQEEDSPPGYVPVVIITHYACEQNVRKAIAEIDQLDFVRAPTQVIRIAS